MAILSKGKIIVKPDKYSYAIGDTITGKVVLDLKEPVQAKELSITLIGYRKSGPFNTDVNRREKRLYDFEAHLDGEKEYASGMEYPFEIPIPEDIRSFMPMGGTLGKIIKVVMSLLAIIGRGSQVKFTLMAKLDVPKGIDVKDTQDVIIQ